MINTCEIMNCATTRLFRNEKPRTAGVLRFLKAVTGLKADCTNAGYKPAISIKPTVTVIINSITFGSSRAAGTYFYFQQAELHSLRNNAAKSYTQKQSE